MELEGYVIMIVETQDSSPAECASLLVGDEIVECIRSKTINLRVKRSKKKEVAVSSENVQNAYIVAVEEDAKRRLEELLYNHKLTPIDMTKHVGVESEDKSGDSNDSLDLSIERAVFQSSMPYMSQPGHMTNGHVEMAEVNGFKDGKKSKGKKGKRGGSNETPMIDNLLTDRMSSQNSLNNDSFDDIHSSVEFDPEKHREMAIDVPKNFQGTAKTPPRLPSSTHSSERSTPVKESAKMGKSYTNNAYSDDHLERIRHHQEEIRKRQEREEQRVKEQEFLRYNDIHAMLQHMKGAVHSKEGREKLKFLNDFFDQKQFQNAVSVHHQVLDVKTRSPPVQCECQNSREVRADSVEVLCSVKTPATLELLSILNKPQVKELLLTHDRVGQIQAKSSDDREPPEGNGEIPANVPDTASVIRIVHLDKTTEPLGATVRNDGESVIISRIVKGGTAEKSGMLHEGDEILDINGIDMKGKDINDVSEMLANMTGRITFTIYPSNEYNQPNISSGIMHVKALFNYDPEDDLYIPCRELGLSFSKCDILHVINQEDSNWWQAYREGEEDYQSLAEPNRRRPIVLIGPPNVGRQELRQRLMESDFERFAAAVPHTSRTMKVPGAAEEPELDGKDYHFVSRAEFQNDIHAGKFIEHGEFERSLYGTSVDAVRQVISSGKICVLNTDPEALYMLYETDLKPYVIFVYPSNIEKLRLIHHRLGLTNVKDDDLRDIIERAREMEDKFGHMFDYILVNQDMDKAFDELVTEINRIEVEPQWIVNHNRGNDRVNTTVYIDIENII
ncbi:MPP5-like protein [Mya arenaria]|uniref:MPP5-like protein n=1 Tax=Mya arenaria TaxID=6604 RepID=A0ABY7FAV5_MYAAR|nr:MPP5-like protein [Mya arenaria]